MIEYCGLLCSVSVGLRGLMQALQAQWPGASGTSEATRPQMIWEELPTSDPLKLSKLRRSAALLWLSRQAGESCYGYRLFCHDVKPNKKVNKTLGFGDFPIYSKILESVSLDVYNEYGFVLQTRSSNSR